MLAGRRPVLDGCARGAAAAAVLRLCEIAVSPLFDSIFSFVAHVTSVYERSFVTFRPRSDLGRQ